MDIKRKKRNNKKDEKESLKPKSICYHINIHVLISERNPHLQIGVNMHIQNMKYLGLFLCISAQLL